MEQKVNRNVALFVLTLIYVFNFMDRQILGVLAEPIKQELDLSDSQLGLLTGFMFALFYSTFGVPIAWLADRTKRTWVVAIACALWSGFSAACGLATNFLTLAAARVGVAVGEAGGVAPSYSLIADLFPRESRARAVAFFSLGSAVGVGAGTAIGGWVAAIFGWRIAFFVVAAPGIALSILLLLLVREPERGRFDGPVANDHAPVSLLTAIALFISSPALMLVSLSAALGAFTCYAMMAWVSSYLIRVLGMEMAEIGSWLSVTLAVGMGAGLWVSGVLTDRLATKDWRMYAYVPAAALILAAPVLGIALATDNWLIALPLLGLAIGLSIFYLPPSVAAVQQIVAPDQRSTAGAMLLLCLNLVGLGGGPLFVGVVSDWTQPQYGETSLRIALIALTPMFFLAVLSNVFSARALGKFGNQSRTLATA